MKRNPSLSNVTDQVVEILRNGMLSRRWRDTLPGRDQLAADLGVSHTTMEAAMRRLAKEGMLVSQGAGRRRRIVLPDGDITPKNFRVRILAYESVDRSLPLLMGMLDQLIKKGFAAKFASKSLLDLGMDAKRVARFVRGVPADAWIVCAGSHDVLEWFREESLRAFAFFGGWSRTPIPGLGVRKDIRPVIRQLVELGHRRIVMLARGVHWQPNTSLFMRNFLDALRSEGIEPSSNHIPTFGYQPEDLHRCLDSLFKVSPPTALFVSEAYLMIAVRDYLARRGILAPRDISLICFDHDHSYPWCVPVISHFAWDYAHVTRRVVRWVTNVARDKDDRRQTFIMAKFIKGGTIGPAPGRKPRI